MKSNKIGEIWNSANRLLSDLIDLLSSKNFATMATWRNDFSSLFIRDFKIQRRGRRRERPKNNRFYKQNNSFARASHFFVHFFPFFARLRRENA